MLSSEIKLLGQNVFKSKIRKLTISLCTVVTSVPPASRATLGAPYGRYNSYDPSQIENGRV